MKKIIRGIVLGILAVVVLGVSVGAYFLFGRSGPDADTKLIITDAKGNSYLAMVDENSGETMVAVTDSKGGIFAAVTDSNGNVGNTVGSVTDVVKIDDLPTNYTGPNINVSVDNSDYRGDIESTTAPSEQTSEANASTSSPGSEQSTSPSKNESNTTTTKKQQPEELTAYRIQKYQQLFAGGTYLMEFTTNDEELGETPITTAVKNNNVYIETEIQGMACKMLYISGTGGEAGTTYLIIDSFKKYCKMPEDLMGEDMDMGNLMGNFGKEIDKKITVSKATVNGKELICESYKTDDGTVVKYYFDGETLVRRDNVNTDGTVDSTYINRLTSDVPDSLFKIPDNYGYLNLSFLDGMLED